MSARALSQWVVVLFLVLGAVGVSLRYNSRLRAKLALEDSLWRLTYDVTFQVDEPEAEVRLALPIDSTKVTRVSEEFTHPGLHGKQVSLVPSGTEELVVAARQRGQYRVTAEFELRLSPSGSGGAVRPPLVDLDGDTRARYTREEDTLPTKIPLVDRVLQGAAGESRSAEERLQCIFDFCSRDLDRAPEGTDNVLEALQSRSASTLGRARTMVTLCRAADMPARMVAGFELRQHDELKPHVWVEVFRGNTWVPFDPELGYARHMPMTFVAARTGGERIIHAPTASAEADQQVEASILLGRATSAPPAPRVSGLLSQYSMLRLGPPQEVLRSDFRRPSQVLDLTRLPVAMHDVLTLVLLLPFGALITSFFRNIVGLKTFGTFGPALLAMSFIYADWITGFVVLTIVLLAGYVGRSLVDRLQLLMVPRLSVLLTGIILFVIFGVSALDYLRLTPSPQAVLLPLVILTMLIERFYVAVEEDGATYSLGLMAGTFFVATCCYLLLRWENVGKTILIYPELHFFTLAMFVIFGRYAGYRITELWRFNDLAQAGGQRPTPPLGGAA